MKKRILSFTLATLMVVATITGCGSKDTTNDGTTNTDVSTDASNSEVNDSNDKNANNEIDSSELGETDEWVYAYTWWLPEGMTGQTEKYTNEMKPDWSQNRTHFVGAENGFIMDFGWEGPLALGECVSESTDGNTLWLDTQNNEYRLAAWVDDLSDEADWAKNADKATIVSWVNTVKYTDGDFYETKEMENGYKVIFKVSNEEYTGYVCFIDDYERLEAHQFIYLEKTDIFDDERALDVVNSIFCVTDYIG